MKKTTKLKRIIDSKNLEFLMEAHNGVSAKIVEETGFEGICETCSISMVLITGNHRSTIQLIVSTENPSKIKILLEIIATTASLASNPLNSFQL